MKTIHTGFLFLILTIITISNSYSQVNIEWASFYPGPESSGEVNAIAVDNSGNVYVTGKSDGSSTSVDIATVKYNSNGAEQWAVRYNGFAGLGWDEGWGIAVDNSGNVYVCGTSAINDTNENFITIKYNSAGVQQWVRMIDGSLVNSGDIAFSIAADNSGNVYVTGYVRPNAGGYNMCTVKYNSAGTPEWTNYYAGPSNISAYAYVLKLDGSGNVYAAGDCQTISSGSDYCIVKYNSGGAIQWVKLYSGVGNDFMHGLTLDNSGNIYVTGESIQFTSYDFCTVKLRPNGDSVWVRRYNGPENGSDQAFSVAADPFGNAIVTGVSINTDLTSAMCTIKYDTAGVQKWVNRYNGEGYSVAFAVATDQTGNSYITGRNFNSSTIKYNSSGVLQWAAETDSCSGGKCIAFGQPNNIYIGGAGGTVGSGYSTIKFNQPIGIQPISNGIPDKFSLSQNYPNPFNPTTTIKFALPPSPQGEGLGVRVIIYDILGRVLETLVNEQLKPGTYEVGWDGSNNASGIYFYRLETENFTDSRKMLLIK